MKNYQENLGYGSKEINTIETNFEKGKKLNSNNTEQTTNSLEIGERVVIFVKEEACKATLKWKGRLENKDGLWFGVEFDEARGSGTGKFENNQLFNAKLNHALIAPASGFMKLKDYEGDTNEEVILINNLNLPSMNTNKLINKVSTDNANIKNQENCHSFLMNSSQQEDGSLYLEDYVFINPKTNLNLTKYLEETNKYKMKNKLIKNQVPNKLESCLVLEKNDNSNNKTITFEQNSHFNNFIKLDKQILNRKSLSSPKNLLVSAQNEKVNDETDNGISPDNSSKFYIIDTPYSPNNIKINTEKCRESGLSIDIEKQRNNCNINSILPSTTAFNKTVGVVNPMLLYSKLDSDHSNNKVIDSCNNFVTNQIYHFQRENNNINDLIPNKQNKSIPDSIIRFSPDIYSPSVESIQENDQPHNLTFYDQEINSHLSTSFDSTNINLKNSIKSENNQMKSYLLDYTNSEINNPVLNENFINLISNNYEVGDMVEIDIPGMDGCQYGVVRWIGVIQQQSLIGIELENECSAATDGRFGRDRLFLCSPKTGYFVKSSNVRRDSRFLDSEKTETAMFYRDSSGSDISDNCSTDNKLFESTLKKNICPPICANTRKDLIYLLQKFSKKVILKRFSSENNELLADICINLDATNDSLDHFVVFETPIIFNLGIQGNRNSCYMDATLFSIFAFDQSFDFILKEFKDSLSTKIESDIAFKANSTIKNSSNKTMQERMKMNHNKNNLLSHIQNINTEIFDKETNNQHFNNMRSIGSKINDETNHNKLKTENLSKSIRFVLIDKIINILRRKLFVRSENMMQLRLLLDDISQIQGFISQEKDPDEFLFCLLRETFKIAPLIQFNSGQSDYFHQLLGRHIYGNKADSPEKEFIKTYSPVSVQQLFELSLNQNGLLLDKVPNCLILQMPRSGSQCQLYHRIIPNIYLEITHLITDKAKNSHGNLSNSDPYTTVKLELYAVICIKTSHFVSFVKTGFKPDSPWLFFDSMSDRMGLEFGFNIPKVEVCKYLPHCFLTTESEFLERLSQPSLIDVPEEVRRICEDAYMCFYRTPNKISADNI